MANDGPLLERARTFAAEPVASRNARHFVVEWLNAHGRAALADRVGLAVSELAANAVLHTSQPFTVSLAMRDECLRVELIDSVPDRMPVPVPTTGSAVDITSISETGRGLQIVGCLANRWGVTIDPNVKRAWAEFESDPPQEPNEPEFQDLRPQAAPAENVHRFVYLGAPVRAAIASGLDTENATRDVYWVPEADRDDDASKLMELIEKSASLRLAGRHAAMHAASQNQLTFDFTLDATDAELRAMGELSDLLASRAAAGRGAPSDEVRIFRRWLSDETRRQRNGGAPRPFGDRRVDEQFDWLFARASTGYAAVDLDGTVRSANEALASALGCRLDALVGRPLGQFLLPASRATFEGPFAAAIERDGHVGNVPLDLDTPAGPVAAFIRGVRDGDVTRLAVKLPSQRAEELVQALQQTLIPPNPPSVPGLDVAAAYHPAQGDVGGDFYDVFEVAENDWCVVLGDVSGKGVDAAIVTAAARHAVRSAALREPVPSGLMHVLNRTLIEQNSTRFCTVALARLQRTHDSWITTLTTGGHPFPLLIRHGTATKLGRPGSLLGVFDDVSFHDVSIRLSVGDALVLFTDGVVEARNAAGELFGDERLHEAVISAPPSAQGIVDTVVARVLEFQSGGASDDVALVAIRRSAP